VKAGQVFHKRTAEQQNGGKKRQARLRGKLGREGGMEGGRNKEGQERHRRTSGQRIHVGRRGDEDRRTCEENEGGMKGGWGEEEKDEKKGG